VTPAAFLGAMAGWRPYGYDCWPPGTNGGGAMTALVVLLLLALAIGFTLGYAVRERISRHRRAAVRAAANGARYRELSADHTLPRLE